MNPKSFFLVSWIIMAAQTNWSSGYVPGTDDQRPDLPIGKHIICTEYIQLGPGSKRIVCNRKMVTDRLKVLETIGDVFC